MKEQICYALKLYTYDYYQWEEVYAVSFSPELLKTHLGQLDCLYSDKPLIDESLHEEYACKENPHWIIEPVKFLK